MRIFTVLLASILLILGSLISCDTTSTHEPDQTQEPRPPNVTEPPEAVPKEEVGLLINGYNLGIYVSIVDLLDTPPRQVAVKRIVDFHAPPILMENENLTYGLSVSDLGRVVIGVDGKTFSVNIDGSDIIQIDPGIHTLYPRISPDGSLITFSSPIYVDIKPLGFGLDTLHPFVMEADGTNARPLFVSSCETSPCFLGGSSPVFSTDGTKIYTMMGHVGYPGEPVGEIDVATGTITLLTQMQHTDSLRSFFLPTHATDTELFGNLWTTIFEFNEDGSNNSTFTSQSAAISLDGDSPELRLIGDVGNSQPYVDDESGIVIALRVPNNELLFFRNFENDDAPVEVRLWSSFPIEAIPFSLTSPIGNRIAKIIAEQASRHLSNLAPALPPVSADFYSPLIRPSRTSQRITDTVGESYFFMLNHSWMYDEPRRRERNVYPSR